MLKLFAFQPSGHGPTSFFVMAESLEAAKEAVVKHIEKKDSESKYSDYTTYGEKEMVLSGSYDVVECGVGEVVENNNS